MPSMPVGGFVAQGLTITDKFKVLHGILCYEELIMSVAAVAGTLVRFKTSAAGQVEKCVSGEVSLVAGILGEPFYDPTALPTPIGQNVYGDGFLNFRSIGAPATVWRQGLFYLLAIEGSVTYGQFLIPGVTAGNFVGSATNPLTNGCIRVLQGNTVSAGPVLAAVNLT